MSLLKTVGFIARHPLSRGRLLRNLGRFLKWQVGSRLVPGPVAIDFVNNARFLARPGLVGATGNIYVGLHDFEDMAFVLHFLRPGDLFVDAGANVGCYTILASACAGAYSVAFEPGIEAFHWLQQNIYLNNISALTEARREALGASAGMAFLTTGMDAVNHIVLEQGPDHATAPVAISTLDAALGDRVPLMLKLDVEGFETEVMAGAKRTLAEPALRCVLMELAGHGERYGFDEDALRTLMREHGFESYQYLPREKRLLAVALQAPGNILFLRDLGFVSERLKTARPFTVLGQTI